MLRLIRSNWLIISVFAISLSFSLFLISPVLLTIPKTPSDTVNMLVGHYFEDYYEYITFVKQGQNGHLILSNVFSNDDPSKYIAVWWPYSLMGFITYLLKIPVPSQIVFWLSSASFSFVFFIIIYVAICRLLPKEKNITKFFAFLFVLFSGDLFTVSFSPKLTFTPISYWYAIGSPFNRFSNAVPHHQLAQIILLLGLLFVSRENKNLGHAKETAVLFVFSLLLLSLSPPQLILFWLAILTVNLITILKGRIKIPKIAGKTLITDLGQRAFLPFLLSLILTLPFAFLLSRQTSSSSSLLAGKIWDISHYYYPSLSLFAQNTGLLLVLAILGLPFYFSRLSFPRLVFFFLVFFSFLLSLAPSFMPLLKLAGIHNLRFETPSSYLFLAASSILFLQKILKKTLFYYALFTAVMFFFSLSLYANFQIMLKVPYMAGNLQFVPAFVYQGIKTLGKTDKLILSAPSSNYGLLTTALTGNKVYLGRSIFTLNQNEKAQKALLFYELKMTENQAKDFLEKENIGYVLLSPWEQDPQKILAKYGFLRIFFQNNYLTIFSH